MIGTPFLKSFERGEHFRELSPEEGKRIYRFITSRRVRLRIDGLAAGGRIISFRGEDGREWMRIDRFGVVIAEGYAWNGCSPKRHVPLLGWIGTPDFKAVIGPSLFHDAFYQFSVTAHFPLHRFEVDAIFRQMIEDAGEEEIAAIYHAAVRKFGSWTGRPPGGEYSVILADERD